MKFALLLLLMFNTVNCIQPQFKNPIAYNPINTIDESKLPTSYDARNPGPYGYSRAVLPYHGNINNNLKNPVIEIKNGLTGTQIQVRVETIINGASICVMDDVAQDGSESCGRGSVDVCYTPARDGMKFEFYCTESCDSDNVDFFYRIVKSNVGANDLWCTNRPANDWPSKLLPTPNTLPPRKTTPPNTENVKSSSVPTFPIIINLVFTLCLLISFILF